MKFQLVWFSLFLTSSVTEVTCHDNYIMTMYKVRCIDVNPKFFVKHQCFLKVHNRTAQLITLQGTLIPTFTLENLFVHIVLNYKFNTFKQLLIDKTEDFCAFVNGTAKAPLISILWEAIRTHGTMKHNCPYKSDEDLLIQDMIFDDSAMPPVLPSGEWRVDINLQTRTKNILHLIATCELYFTITPKGNKLLKMG